MPDINVTQLDLDEAHETALRNHLIEVWASDGLSEPLTDILEALEALEGDYAEGDA